MRSIGVTFDTNVFNHIVRPIGCHDDGLKEICTRIAAMIAEGKIQPNVSETIFNLEGIERKDRSSYFGGYEASRSSETIPTNNPNIFRGLVCLSPNFERRPESNPLLVEKLARAREMGFRILSAPRIALPKSPYLMDSDFGTRTMEEMRAQQDLFYEALDFITSLKAGSEAAKAIGNKYRTTEKVWYHALKHASQRDATRAIGEWSDGDSVAAHISYRLEYFCTRDEAKGAGAQSIFAPGNRAKIGTRFGLVFVTPEELLTLIEAP